MEGKNVDTRLCSCKEDKYIQGSYGLYMQIVSKIKAKCIPYQEFWLLENVWIKTVSFKMVKQEKKLNSLFQTSHPEREMIKQKRELNSPFHASHPESTLQSHS